MAHPRRHRDPSPPTRSRGGFGTKLHIAVDGLGDPVEFILTGGQEADVNQGKALIEDHDSKAVIADKWYDGEEFVEAIQAGGAAAVISPKKNRIFKREYDKHLYKQRNCAERLINRIK